MPSAAFHAPFVGRDHELSIVESALALALAGAGQSLLVAGEAGIGKTRMVEQLAERARAAGALVLWGHCDEWEGAPAYWPWAQAFAGWAAARDGADLAELGASAAFLAPLLPGLVNQPADPALEPDARAFQTSQAAAALLRAIAREQPVLVVLDDIQWADRPSLVLLRAVVQDIRAARVLLVSTLRTGELRQDEPASEIVADLARQPHHRRLLLRGLARPEVARIVSEVTGTAPAAELVDAVFAETSGNPFFVTEVARLLADEGRLSGAPEPDSARLGVPDSIREAVRRRLQRLTPHCRRALALGAVIGREFDARILAQAAGSPLDALLDDLDEAVGANLLVPDDVPGHYRFSHALVQEALYRETAAGERARQHLAVGLALEHGQADRAAELAHHFYHAGPLGDPARLARYAEAAGQQAMAQSAWQAAALQFARALDALDVTGYTERAERVRRCELLLALGEARNRSGPGSGDAPAAREAFARAFALARELELPGQLARAAIGFAGLNIVTSFAGSQRQQFLEAALAALDPADHPLRARVLGWLAVDLWNRSTANLDRSRSLADEAVATATRLNDPGLIAFALWARHYSGCHPDNLDERSVLADQIVARAEQAGDPVIAAWGYVARTLDRLEAGDLAGSRQALAALREFDERARIPYLTQREAAYHAMLDLLTGDYAGAAEHAALARDLWQSPSAHQHQLQAFVLLRDLGRLDELTDEIVLPDPANLWGVATRAHRMLLALERGQFSAARNDYDALVADDFAAVPFDCHWFGVVVPLAEAAIALRDVPRSERLAELLAPYADRLAFAGILGVCHGPVALTLGRLATALGRWREADAHLEAALATAERLGLRPYAARTLLARAQLLQRRGASGDRAAALDELQRAIALADTLGMAGLQPEDAELRRALAERRSSRFGLTARELDVLRLVAEGLTDAEVAERLFLSRRTVGTHLTSIYGKLGVGSRTAAARVAFDNELL